VSWPERKELEQGIVDMLSVNMGLAAGERLLVVTDLPRAQDWQTMPMAELQSMIERAALARLVADVAQARFPAAAVSFHPFPASGGHGTEPDDATAARLRETDVAVAITSFSLSHTNARLAATDAGVRLASAPGFEAGMLAPGGPMAVDYQQVAADCRAFAGLLSAAGEARVRTAAGTDLRFSLAGRRGEADDGIYGTARGSWGNLPAGEAYIAPVEGTASGRMVVPAGWHPGLESDMLILWEAGQVVAVEGGGPAGDQLRRLLAIGSEDAIHRARRNLAELGVGGNGNARRPDNVLEAEKIKGTIHLAVGDNMHMGGTVESDLHEDFVIPEPDLILDGRTVIARGVWQL